MVTPHQWNSNRHGVQGYQLISQLKAIQPCEDFGSGRVGHRADMGAQHGGLNTTRCRSRTPEIEPQSSSSRGYGDIAFRYLSTALAERLTRADQVTEALRARLSTT